MNEIYTRRILIKTLSTVIFTHDSQYHESNIQYEQYQSLREQLSTQHVLINTIRYGHVQTNSLRYDTCIVHKSRSDCRYFRLIRKKLAVKVCCYRKEITWNCREITWRRSFVIFFFRKKLLECSLWFANQLNFDRFCSHTMMKLQNYNLKTRYINADYIQC